MTCTGRDCGVWHGMRVHAPGCAEFLGQVDVENTPSPVPFSPQPPQERPENGESPHKEPENGLGTVNRPHPITRADVCAVAARTLLNTADQLRDSAEDYVELASIPEHPADQIWRLKPWQLIAVADYLEARAGFYAEAP